MNQKAPFLHPELPAKTILHRWVFTQSGADPLFTAHSRAAQFAEQLGYSVGMLQGDKCPEDQPFPPCALVAGFHAVPEWGQFCHHGSIDGALTGDMRHGPVHVLLYQHPAIPTDFPEAVESEDPAPVSFELALLQHVGKHVVLRTVDGLSYGHGETTHTLLDVGADLVTVSAGKRTLYFRLAAITHFHSRD